MSLPSPKLSIVLPCLNEGPHLWQTLETIYGHLDFLEGDFELWVIDDGSSDNTWEVIERASKETTHLHGIRLSRRFGKELALTAGLERARGKAILLMDADLQHPPSLIPEMVRHWEKDGYDIVEAVKRERNDEPVQIRIGAHVFGRVAQKLCGFDLLGASDFKLMDRRVLDAWSGMSERNVFFRGMSAWLGFRRMSLPFEVQPRVGGRTNWSSLQLIRLGITSILSYSSIPIHLVTVMGGVFFGFASLFGVITLAAWFSGKAVEGFTTVILLQLLIASMIMLALGVLGTYISLIYEEVKGRPRFIISKTVGHSSDRAVK